MAVESEWLSALFMEWGSQFPSTLSACATSYRGGGVKVPPEMERAVRPLFESLAVLVSLDWGNTQKDTPNINFLPCQREQLKGDNGCSNNFFILGVEGNVLTGREREGTKGGHEGRSLTRRHTRHGR